MTARQKITFSCGDNTLCGEIDAPAANVLPTVLFLHGGGTSGKTRTAYFAESLAEHGFASLRFDFSGHGESSGTLGQSSLTQRMEEAMAAVALMDNTSPLAVIATSMAGEIAIRLTPLAPIANLYLFCPALYDRAAYDIPFNAGFSDIIRQEDSWKNSQAIDIIKDYTGNMFIYYGLEDGIIPRGVIDLLHNNAHSANHKELHLLPDVGHQIHALMESGDPFFQTILTAITSHAELSV